MLCLRGWVSPSCAPAATWIRVDPDRDFLGTGRDLGAFLAQPPAGLSCHTPGSLQRGGWTQSCAGNPWRTHGLPEELLGLCHLPVEPREPWAMQGSVSAVVVTAPGLCRAPGAAQAGIVGLSVQGQQLEPVVLTSPFQLRTFCELWENCCSCKASSKGSRSPQVLCGRAWAVGEPCPAPRGRPCPRLQPRVREGKQGSAVMEMLDLLLGSAGGHER